MEPFADPSHQPIRPKRLDDDWEAFDRELTPAETRILQAMAAGFYDREIAQLFSLSPITIKMHVKRIYRVLGAKNRPNAVAIGFRKNLLH